ncbi:type II toxin-antitoxin system RelE/ParE family toxin [Pseudoalteromonas sp. SR44-8]|uniref:type II toxin-antitoxin system RelE/ParE family toxin n=1 Tax=Pseudoalteromonas sp. SR44-8 TaxID=2760933 RepID=UPI001601C98F|nr:type II toxin-antitoxin system RelE/ParE family toxin [Pseudoalteromonas sp. SR44-8]MBB1302128.1 type II toxin-antitoxin system RelE/ParE family toxin [Pseudoalteromonas sp. SR44-8]
MAEIIWTNPALEDLNDIAEYIALSNLLSAKKLVAKIFAKVEHLEDFPESGKTPIELSNMNYREVIVNPCRIFYKIDNDKVFILHIMRQERDLRKFLLQM